MSKLLERSLILLALLVLTMGPLMGGPVVRAGDDARSERFDLDLSRHDRGELWDDDSHEVLRDRHREQDRESDREHEKERDGHRETNREREIHHDREGDRDRDNLRERSRDHDRDHEGLREREKQDD